MKRNILNWTVAGIVVFVFVASGLFKLSGAPATAEMAKGLGGHGKLIFLGTLEIVIAALFVFNRTGVAGALLMMAYMGGAIAIHFVHGQPVMLVVVVEILIWIAAALRFPELTRRLFSGSSKHVS